MPFPIIAAIIAAGATIYSGYRKGKEARKIADSNSDLMTWVTEENYKFALEDADDAYENAAINADVARKDANVIEKLGRMEADALNADAKALQVASAEEAVRRRYEDNRVIGMAGARIGASGVTFSGTPMMALQESVTNAQKNTANIIARGEIESERIRKQAGLITETASEKKRRLEDMANYIIDAGKKRLERMKKGAEYEREAGLRGADLEKLQGRIVKRTAITSGVASGIGAGISMYSMAGTGFGAGADGYTASFERGGGAFTY